MIVIFRILIMLIFPPFLFNIYGMGKLTYMDCKSEALLYNSRYDLEKSNRSVYRMIKKNNWEELFSHMETRFLTYDKCKSISFLYQTKTELIKNNCSVYNKIIKNNWIELLSHMKTIGNRYKRMIYAYEFNDNHCYVGLTYNLESRNKKHLYSNSKSPVYNHMILTGSVPILLKKSDYVEVEIAKNMEGEILNDYKNKGWNILNSAKTGSVGGVYSKWTYDVCKELSLKYENRCSLKKELPSVYNSINRNKWYELFSHMETKKKNWTLHEILETSKDYKKISHFHKDYSGAYFIAKKNGWLSEITKHMDKPKGKWTLESCINEFSKYENKKEFMKNSSGAYQAAKRNKWLNKLESLLS